MVTIQFFLIFCMLAVLWSDVSSYRIPNPLVVAMLALYPITMRLAPHPVEWEMALVAGLIMFVAGYVIFVLKWMGAGDIKLISVCALWVGLENLIDFTFAVTAIGGMFSVVLWLARKIEPQIPWKLKMPRIMQEGAPVPYGVAIAFGFLIMMYWNKIPVLA